MQLAGLRSQEGLITWAERPRRPVKLGCEANEVMDAFHSTKKFGISGWESEWNRHFTGFHSEILGVPREIGLKRYQVLV